MSLMLPILLAVAATRITAGSSYYDRQEGIACFNGGVTVDDPQYQLHADRALVSTDETNSIRRIVAIGNVSITNGTKRAYGAKASYHHATGMIVLYADDGRPAEVRDEARDGAQVVRGKKIKFWTGTRQVEVVEAEISTPSKGVLQGLQGAFGR